MNWEMPFIFNTSLDDIVQGTHLMPNPKTVLIQIVDHDREEFPTPHYIFGQRWQFAFADTNDADDPNSIRDDQAAAIAKILTEALADGRDVVVHCHAGICRSGAVVECGVALGFIDPERLRKPNTLVKTKIMAALGLRITSATSMFNTHQFDYD